MYLKNFEALTSWHPLATYIGKELTVGNTYIIHINTGGICYLVANSIPSNRVTGNVLNSISEIKHIQGTGTLYIKSFTDNNNVCVSELEPVEEV